MFMKKNKYDELHEQQAMNITKNIFCVTCSEHEGFCRERTKEHPRCFTFTVVKEKIKRIFDKYD